MWLVVRVGLFKFWRKLGWVGVGWGGLNSLELSTGSGGSRLSLGRTGWGVRRGWVGLAEGRRGL